MTLTLRLLQTALTFSLCVLGVTCRNFDDYFDRLPNNHPCRLVRPRNPDESVAIPETCDKGHIEWSYPSGNFTLEVSRPGETFDICLSQTRALRHSGWVPRINGVKDVTAGRDARLPRLTVPLLGKTRCSTSQEGNPYKRYSRCPRGYKCSMRNPRLGRPNFGFCTSKPYTGSSHVTYLLYRSPYFMHKYCTSSVKGQVKLFLQARPDMMPYGTSIFYQIVERH